MSVSMAEVVAEHLRITLTVDNIDRLPRRLGTKKMETVMSDEKPGRGSPQTTSIAAEGEGTRDTEQSPEADDADTNMVTLDSEHADSVPAREAAKWRGQLRQAEAERDTLAGKVEALQRTQIDAHVAATGLKPAALWASGAQLADLVGDDGTPDQQKIAAAVATAREQLGSVNDRPKRPARGGLTSGASVPREPVNKWREAFAPPNRR